MKYQKKPVIVDAVQWNKHGDHPEVVRPDCSKHTKGTIDGLSLCSCGALGYQHGLLCDSKYWKPVCPGSYIYATPGEDRTHKIVDKADFEREFEPVKEIKVDRRVHSLNPDEWPDSVKEEMKRNVARFKCVYNCHEVSEDQFAKLGCNTCGGYLLPRDDKITAMTDLAHDAGRCWPSSLTRAAANEVYAAVAKFQFFPPLHDQEGPC